jgi:CRP-like cAMP-binding protein
MMFFEQTDLFGELSREVLDAVAAEFTELNLQEGQRIFSAGDKAEFLYVLVEGRVRLSLGGKGTVTRVFSRQGDAFGWSSLLKDTYTATASALSVAKVQRISGQKMNDIFKKYPDSGVIFYRKLASLVRERLIDSYKTLLTYEPESRPLSFG